MQRAAAVGRQGHAVAPDIVQPEAIVRRTGRLLGAASEGREGYRYLTPTAEVVNEAGLEALRRVGRLIDPHVVHLHLLRQRQVGADRAAEVAADSQVQDHVEGVVEDPLVGSHVGRGRVVVVDAIHEPVNFVGRPLHREGVVVLGHRLLQSVGVTEGRAARVTGAVDRAEHLIGIAADVLHDVDLAALRPTDLADVGAQHPEGRPQPGCAVGHENTGLDAAILRLDLVSRDQAGRGVLARAVPAKQLLRRLGLIQSDGQVAAAIGGCVVGVELQLAVAPAGDAVERAVADLRAPDVGIGGRAGRVVELVAPDQFPVAGRCLGGSGRLVVQYVDGDRLAAVAAIVPEAEPVVAGPVLAVGEGAREAGSAAAGGAVDAGEDVLVGPLARHGHGRARHDLGDRQVHITRWLEAVEALEIVEHSWVRLVNLENGQHGLHLEAGVGIDRIAQVEHQVLVALVLVVQQGDHLKRLLKLARIDYQCTAGGNVVPIWRGIAFRSGVVDGDRQRGGHVEGYGDHRGVALRHFVSAAGELDLQRFDHPARVTEDRHLVHVIGIAAHVHIAIAADAVAVYLGQGEAIVGRAIADILAMEVAPGELEELPAGEVIGDVQAPALGVIGG